jgi:hypothetical protein
VAPALAAREGEAFLRLICSFDTSDAEIDRLLAVAAGVRAAGRG